MKFFNSDKSGFLSFVAKRMKALFALFFIIAGVQTLSAALVKGGWDGWQNHDLIHVADNEYYVDIIMTNAATDEFGIDFNGSFYSLSNYTITNWCSSEKFYTNNSNCKFTHNAGTYRFRVWDYGNDKTLTITGIIVTIDQPVQNADGSYTITGRFTNANPGQQNIHTYQIVFSEGVGQGVGANEPATVGEDGSFSINKQLVEGQQYTCCARAIDGSIGNHDSEYITFIAEAATPEPEPTVTDLYIFGVDDNWSNPSDEWKCTSVSQDGNVYTWDWSSAKIFNGGTYFKVGAKNAENTGIDDNNNYGPSGSDATLDFNGVQSIVQTVVNSSQSKAFTVSSATEISKIEFNKSTLTVTFYAPVEAPDPVTPTADSYVVTWAEPVYEAEAGTVVLSATVAAAEDAGFALADGTFEAQINVVGLASSARTILSETNQYTISHTISRVAANQQIDYSLQIVTGGGNPLVNTSDVQNLNPQTYTVPEAEPEPEPEPVSLYLIGAGTVAQWNLDDALPFTYENGVYTWTGELAVNNEAFKILTSNTEWEPAYVAETDQFEVVLGEAIALYYREKSGDNQYTRDDNKFKITEGGEYTIKVTLGGDNSGSMIVTKKSDPVYAATITAVASVAEQVSLASTLTETAAGTNLATATCVFQYKAADAGDGTYAVMTGDGLSYSGEGATRTATLSQDMAAGDYVFRAVWTYNSAEVANAVTETVTIPSDTPTPTDIDFYVRGEKIGCIPSESGNCWGVASEEFKATSKEGNVYVWDWASKPKLMVGPFKIADANFSDENNYGLENETPINLTDGKWTGTLQVNTASGDMEISEPGWNVSKITFDYDTKILEIFATPVFKDIWFRSSIVENGWGDDISDPIGSGVSPKYQGQTTDGKVYTWDWRGSKAVTLESSTEFKFGEYKGTSWAASGYAPNGQASVTSADFGKEISVQVAAGNFSAGEKITITKITLDTETLKLVLEGEQYKERFPVTVNTVNGEVGGSVVTDPVDIGALAIGETVTVTATANEGYVALFEATSGCVMTGGSADNIKVFEITAANPVITVTFQVQCQTVEPRFTISGQFNFGMDSPWVGTPIKSGEADPADGYWSDGARFVQLTANSVTANYFKWECVGYAIDGHAVVEIPKIAWTGNTTTSARAELSKPGTYTFVCKAKCNETDEWTNSAELTITAPAPEMGFNGNIVTNHDWGNPEWAGQADGGYMTRRLGSLTWVSNPFTVDGFGTGNTDYHFVIDQRYKFLGCVKQNGWTENNECNDLPGDGNNKDNKINRSNLTFENVAWDGEQGANFAAINPGNWTAGVNGTQLQLTVTMTDWDSYTVELAKKQEQIFANYSSNDETMGTVAMKVGDTPIAYGADITGYIGEQVTLTATPAQGYKVASWEINGKVTESDKTTISPTLSGAGLKVVVTFKRDCYAGVAYDLIGGGVICADGGSTELSLNTLNNVKYQLYQGRDPYGEAVQGNGEAAKWTISEEGTYTAKAYDSRFEECQSQAIDMNGSAVVTTVTAPEITVNPGENVHLTVLQARSFTADVPVDWSITDVTGSGGYCDGDGYMISSQTDTSLVAKFLCIGTAEITATMKDPNQNCMAEVTVTQNGAETEACAPEPEDMQ